MASMTTEAKFEAAIKLLVGSNANFVLCCASTALSVLAAGLGIYMVEEESSGLDLANKKAFAVQSLLFLFAQSFTLAKTARDHYTASREPAVASLKPTMAYMVQVLAFFFIALATSAYSLVVMSVAADWKAFFAMIIVWITVNALCLSKAIRDRHDAAASRGLPLERQEARLHQILDMCRGNTEFKALVWFAAVGSVLLMLGTMWCWSNDILAPERKGYVSGMVVFSLVSCFHLAKLVRDRADPMKKKELDKQIPYQALVLISSMLSSGALVAGACLMPLSPGHRLFILTGSCFTTSSALYLAKHIRDVQEAELLGQPPVVHGSVVVVRRTDVEEGARTETHE